MLDGAAKQLIDPALTRAGNAIARAGLRADAVTWAGFGLGLAAAAAIAAQWHLAGLFLILASRLCDGLDGAVARATQRTDFGGFLDIVLDFGFYGLIPAAFALADPAANGMAAAVLLLSFYINGASFLAFAILAQKRGLEGEARGSKSFFFSTGLTEAGETLAAFALMCLFPAWFPAIAWVFAALVFWTAAMRLVEARRAFRD